MSEKREVDEDLEGGGGKGEGEAMRSKNDVEMGSMGNISDEEEESLLDEAGRSRTVSPTLHQGENLHQGEKEEKSPSPGVPAVIITPSRHRDQEKHSDYAPRAPSTPRLARLASPDPDIQLADPPPLSSSPSKSSTLQSMCGPKPAKVAIICLVVVSIWAAWVVVIHLNKKIDILNEDLSQSSHKMKSMDDASVLYRSKSAKRMQRIQEELERVVATLDKGSRKSSVLPSVHPVQSVPFKPNNQNSNKELPSVMISATSTPKTKDHGTCTESGDPCVFPFTHNGETHLKCVQAWTDPNPWCATATGPQGQFIEDSSSWSYCKKCS